MRQLGLQLEHARRLYHGAVPAHLAPQHELKVLEWGASLGGFAVAAGAVWAVGGAVAGPGAPPAS